jgi:hypothetical protein
MIETYAGPVDVEQLSDGNYVWVWTSPGGACHQGPKRYRRRGDAQRAGQQWLAQLVADAVGQR